MKTSILCFLPVIFYILFVYLTLPKGTINLKKSLIYFSVGTLSVPLLLGFIKCFPCTQDFIRLDNPIFGGGFDDFLIFSFIQVALLEEFSKITAFKLTDTFDKYYNPISTMFYCGISTLGFAFVENVKYANLYGDQIILMRSFFSMFLHFLCGLLMGYWFGLSKLPSKTKNRSHFDTFIEKHKLLKTSFYMITAVLFSMLLHGIFDFSLFTKSDLTDTFIIVMCGTLSTYFCYLNLNTLYKKTKFIE